MTSQRATQILSGLWLTITAGLILFFCFQASAADREIATRTLMLGLGAAAISIPLGSLLTWVILGQGIVSRTVLIATIVMLAIPVFLQVSVWDAAFGKLGWLTSVEGQVLTPLVSGWQAATWIHGVSAAPQVAMILLLGLSTGRREFEEQALLDTNRLGVFLHVTLIRITPLIVLSVLWTVIVSVREIAATDIYQIGTLAEQVYLGYSLGQFNTIAGTWTAEQLVALGDLNALVAMVMIAWLSITSGYLFFRFCSIDRNSGSQRPLRPGPTNASRSCVGIVLLVVLILVPIGNLVIRGCYFVRPVNGVPTPGYSIAQLADTLGRACRDYTSEFTWSILIAGVSASLILVAAVVISWRGRRSAKWQGLFVASLAVSCAVPGPMMGTWIATLFTSFDNPTIHWLYNRTICAPVMANVWFCWPLAPLVVWYVFSKIANDALEQAEIDGAGGVTRFFRFGILGNLPAIAGCWLVSFIICFGELSASQIVLPPGIDTVPRLMLGLLHAGVDEMTAALTLITIGAIVVVSSFSWMLIRRIR